MYDSADYLIDDGENAYLYDAEGRICALQSYGGAMTGYQYDAAGNRIAKGSISTWSCDLTQNGFQKTSGFVVGPSGEQLTEVDGSGTWRHTNVYAGGKLIGTYDTAGLHFYIDDPLGTRRAQVSAAGVLEATYQSLQFGDGLNPIPYVNGIEDPTENHFTGKERDTESGNDYMFARYYNSVTGRFLSPDWSAEAQPVPYASLGDPQTLNLYGYVGNNPISGFDPNGHENLLADVVKDTLDAEWAAVGETMKLMANAKASEEAKKKAKAQKRNYQLEPTETANVPVTVSRVSANNPFGHSTIAVGSDKPVGLVPNSTAQAAEHVAMQTGGLSSTGFLFPAPVPGHIESPDANEIPTSQVTIYVTNDQARAMRGYISESTKSSQSYDGALHNCTNFSEEVLAHGGIQAPAAVTPQGLVNYLSAR